MTARRQSRTASTAARRVSAGTLLHSRINYLFSDSILKWALAQPFVSKMDQIEKSIRFRSGLEGGHSSSEINPVTLFKSQA